MKNKLLCFLTLIPLLYSGPVYAQLQQQTRQVLFTPADNRPYIIQPGNSLELDISLDPKPYPVRRSLRVVGGGKMPGRFAARGEELFRQSEFLIDDHLDSVNVFQDRYSLYFEGHNDPFERHAYNRISVPDIKPGKIRVEIPVKRKKLSIADYGDFGIELQLYFRHPDRHPDEVYDSPDSLLYIPVPVGSGNFRLLSNEFDLPENITAILVRVGGTAFSGECWIEAPRMFQSGHKVWESPFVRHDARESNYNYWVGVNMSTRSWPLWELKFNGKTVFKEKVFDRASNVADFYIPLPGNVTGEGMLELALHKEAHRAAFPYEIRSLELIEETARDFEIVSLPRYVAVGDTAGILVETNKPNMELELTAGSGIEFQAVNYRFKETGLHAISFTATEPGIGIPVEIKSGGDTRKADITQAVLKKKDHIYLSTGDDFYIDKEFAPYDRFFKWYFRERAGNWFQFRPSYQWSGVRITRDEVIKHYTGLLQNLNMPYAWQVEGRTLAASRINPSLGTLSSPLFRGKQAHENDGGYYYWQHFHYTGLFSDMAARTRPYGGIFAKHRPIYKDYGIFIHYDPYGVRDMADGANKYVANLNYSRGESTRHTGPSTTFRYLYQAGYDWLGAEQMYGPEDVVMSALRGASRAYGKKDYGSLHAMQWGSFPFTDPKHSLRFYMSLAIAYMHGSSHINTEDALWIDEYANDRFSESGRQHMYAQHQMLDYIETHSRQGEQDIKIAVLQGRNDPWKSFGRHSAWSQKGEKWEFSRAMESFDMLRIFYPGNIINSSGPDGWFTSTPYGPVDILPIEAPLDVMERYDALVFLGWNTFDNTDFIRIGKFVERGGTLILTAAHLNSELQPDKPVSFPEEDSAIKKLLGLDYRYYSGKKEIPFGKGMVIYYPDKVYPADSSVKESYELDIRRLADGTVTEQSSKAWVKPTPWINFSPWDTDSTRTLYVLNVDWRSEEDSRPAVLLLGGVEFPFSVPRYNIATIRCLGNLGGMLAGNTSDIIGIENSDKSRSIICQTTGSDTLTVFDAASGISRQVNIPSAGIHKIVIEP